MWMCRGICTRWYVVSLKHHVKTSIKLDCTQRAQTSAKAKISNKVIRDSSPHVWIHSNPDVYSSRFGSGHLRDGCQNVVDSFMHFAKFCKNSQWLHGNANKSHKIPYSAMARKWKSNPEYISWSGLPQKVNQFFWLVGLIITPSITESGWLCLQ